MPSKQRKKNKLVRALWKLGEKHCPDCGKEMYFPGYGERIAVFAARHGVTRKQAHKRAVSLDHIHPRSKGGTHDPKNLRITCVLCNCKKGNKVVSHLRKDENDE